MMPFVIAHFDGEAPAIGSGRRLVHVTCGRRWMTFRCPYSFRSARIEIAIGRRLIVAETPRLRIGELRKRITATFGRRPPAMVRAMLAELRGGSQ